MSDPPVKEASAALDRISRSSNAIPDAVLNATKCVVVVPSLPCGMNREATGVATCRQTSNLWSTPSLVKFTGRGSRSRTADLLILVLTDEGVRGLRSGQLRIQAKKLAPAPLVNTSPIPTQVDLTRESLSYESDEGVLSSSKESGIISSAPVVLPTRSNVGDRGTSSDTYRSALTSLFNTITPTGIVIHHTAVIPTQNTPPASERDVDRYHQTRGFEILCQSRIYHVAYHYLILADGRVQAGRPETCEGAHAEGYNSYLGISLVGDFSTRDNPSGNKGLPRPTEQQIASLIQLCHQLRTRYRIPLQHIVRHSDISRTKCPGDRFPFAFFLHKLAEQPTPLKAGQK